MLADIAALYDLVLLPAERAGLGRLRRRVVAGVAGRVLEIGVGTGLNTPHYDPGVRVVGLDPHLDGLKRARTRADESGRPLSVVQGSAEDLPFPDGSFDSVIATLAFCTVPDPDLALAEIRRVTRPGGEFRLLEHVRAHTPIVARIQDLVDPAWSALLAGCHPNRDTLTAVRNAGFHVRSVRPHLRGLVLEIAALT